MSSKPSSPPAKPKQTRKPSGQGTSKSARRRRARKGGKSSGPLIPSMVHFRTPGSPESYVKAYADCLDDPFRCEPVRLGFGTLIPTVNGVARIRSTVTAHADSSLLIGVVPSAGNMVFWSAQGAAAVPVWAAITDGAVTSARLAYSTARPVSLGISVTPVTTSTSAPSRVIANLIPFTGVTNASTLNTTTYDTWSSTHASSQMILPSGGAKTAMYTWRPQDMTNFMFNDTALNSSGSFPFINTQSPVLMIALNGVASGTYWIDAIFHYEAIPSVISNAGSLIGAEYPSASDYFPSVEKLWASVEKYLTPQNVVRAFDAVEFMSTSGKHVSGGNLKTVSPSNLYGLASAYLPVPSSHLDEKKAEFDRTKNSIHRYIGSLETSSLSDSERQHLICISQLLDDSVLEMSGTGSPFVSPSSRIPILRDRKT